MKILFTTNKRNSASTKLNLQKLELLNDVEGVTLDTYKTDYENYDVVLFMGYDFDIQAVRAVNKNALVGIIDPRPAKDNPHEADFILANGIEMEDYYYRYCSNIFNYYIYPHLEPQTKKHENKEKIILGYHGNKVHLEEMYPRITDAIEMLGKTTDQKVKLRAIYDIKNLGEFNYSPKHFTLEHIQWEENTAYSQHLYESDIGLVPDIIPLRNESKIKEKAQHFNRKFNEAESDYMLRFKVTSNPGRIFPFMQYDIPVVCDMFPSALQMIQDGENGFIAHHTDSWYFKLKMLAKDPLLRENIGKAGQEIFEKNYSTEVLNEKLVSFLEDLLNSKDKYDNTRSSSRP